MGGREGVGEGGRREGRMSEKRWDKKSWSWSQLVTWPCWIGWEISRIPREG